MTIYTDSTDSAHLSRRSHARKIVSSLRKSCQDQSTILFMIASRSMGVMVIALCYHNCCNLLYSANCFTSSSPSVHHQFTISSPPDHRQFTVNLSNLLDNSDTLELIIVFTLYFVASLLHVTCQSNLLDNSDTNTKSLLNRS